MRMRWTLSMIVLAVPAAAGTVSGRVEIPEKNGKAGDPSDAVVYVEGLKARPKPLTAVVAMKGKQFLPRVTVVPVGSTVTFPNDDPIFHNVFSLSGQNRFDLDLYKRPRSGTRTFEHPGVVRVYCNIHPQMSAVVLVVDSAHHVQPGKDGAFSIPDLPAGRYTLRAWHERGGEASAEVEVKAQGATDAALVLDASKFKRTRHKNKYGKDYSTLDTY